MSIPVNSRLTSLLRILFCIVLLEYLLFIFSGVSFSSLQGDPFFNIEADPVIWIVYLTKIPQFITMHQEAGFILDGLIILLLLLFIRNPHNCRLALSLMLLLFVFYATLTGYLTHRNYQVGFFMIFIPFIFKKDINKIFAFEATRYFILFFYVSAAFLKLYNQSISAGGHFSQLIMSQFTPYFLEGNTGIRTSVNLYLINHPSSGYVLYLLSFIAECTAIIGFFTKKYDQCIALLLLAFHMGNWFFMDIAPFGQVAFICLLFLSPQINLRAAGNRERSF